MEENEITEKKRGGCLTSFLILVFIANPVIAIIYLVAIFSGAGTLPEAPLRYDESLFLLAMMGIINLFLAISIWKWKRIGIYGMWISSIIVMTINLYLGHSFGQSFLGLFGPLILTVLVLPKWKEFK